VSEKSGWFVLAQFGARWEADLLVEALRAAKIPVLVEGGDPAIFGPGAGGGFSPTVAVRVPIEFADYAEDIRSVFDTGPPGASDTLTDDPETAENPVIPEDPEETP
jgi:hypothetical protein